MFSLLIKPMGSICNLKCEYCFYLEKQELYPNQSDFRMTEETLERLIRQYIASQSGPEIIFAWQGGEPTLLGLDFFTNVIKLQQKHLPQGWHVKNVIQTNGTLLDEAWCKFLKDHDFLVGLSLDGPAEFHDLFRKDKQGQSTHKQVAVGLKLLQQYEIEYNVLCAVNSANVGHPLKVYEYFLEQGVKFIQFIPIVEQLENDKVSHRSITGRQYGHFLTMIFNQWLLNDFGSVSIQLFEECFSAWAGFGSNLCVFSETCGRALVVEHNGDVYTCDHFVNPHNLLGNIFKQDLAELADCDEIKKFGLKKKLNLPLQCKNCPVLFVCHGGCLKNRIGGINYLCQGYQQFFSYIAPFMQTLVKLIRAQKSVNTIREQMKAIYDSLWGQVGRNDLCPCQSGRKYKKCCLDYQQYIQSR